MARPENEDRIIDNALFRGTVGDNVRARSKRRVVAEKVAAKLVKKVSVVERLTNLAFLGPCANSVKIWVGLDGGIAGCFHGGRRVASVDDHCVLKERKRAEDGFPAGAVFIAIITAHYHELLGHGEDKSGEPGNIILRRVRRITFDSDFGSANQNLRDRND